MAGVWEGVGDDEEGWGGGEVLAGFGLLIGKGGSTLSVQGSEGFLYRRITLGGRDCRGWELWKVGEGGLGGGVLISSGCAWCMNFQITARDTEKLTRVGGQQGTNGGGCIVRLHTNVWRQSSCNTRPDEYYLSVYDVSRKICLTAHPLGFSTHSAAQEWSLFCLQHVQ